MRKTQSQLGGQPPNRIARATAAIRGRYTPVSQSNLRFLKFFSWCRAKFWGLLLGMFTDGISSFVRYPLPAKNLSGAVAMGRKVRLPEGPLVVVANHASHADSAALLAVLGRSRPVLVAAAADYWLSEAATEFMARTIVGIWPIRRDTEDAWQDLSAAAELVKAGVVIVVFAEGSRTKTGELGEFHSGAARLAAISGATLLPIAILGTRDVLPRGADRANRKPINLRFGEPIELASDDEASTDAATSLARSAIAAELKNPVVSLPGFGWQRVSAISYTWAGLAILFFWAVGEGIFWPLIAEMPLLLLIVTVGLRTRGLVLIAASALGSAVGFTLTWLMVSNGIEPISPFTTPSMFEAARLQLQTDPSGALWSQFWNGIPVKVYAHEAGQLHLSYEQLLTTLLPRITRIFVIGGGGWLLGGLLKKWLRPCLGMIQVTALSFFPLGLWLAVWFWE